MPNSLSLKSICYFVSTNRNQSTDEEKFSLGVKNLIVASGQTPKDTFNLSCSLVSELI